MQRVRTVLVGVDLGSETELVSDILRPSSAAAVRRGIWLAAASRTELILATVVTVPKVDDDNLAEASAEQRLLQAAGTTLEKVAQEARQAGVAQVKTLVLTGRVSVALIQVVLQHAVGLLIVGTSRRADGSPSCCCGSTMQLLRNCPCPVWVHRPCLGVEMPTILVADDLSEVGLRALFMGVSAAQRLSARLLVLHAADVAFDRRLFRFESTAVEIEAYRQRMIQEAKSELYERISQTDYRTIEQGVRVEVVCGPPATVIEAALTEHQIDLLVMGAISRGDVAGELAGDIAEGLWPRIDCSLLVLKPDDFVCPVVADV